MCSCVEQWCSVKSVASVDTVQNLPVEHLALEDSLKFIRIFQEGYTLLFRKVPTLTWSPGITSGYVNTLRSSYLMETLLAFMHRDAVELVTTQISLGFYNRLSLVPKPNNQRRLILDLNNLARTHPPLYSP